MYNSFIQFQAKIKLDNMDTYTISLKHEKAVEKLNKPPTKLPNKQNMFRIKIFAQLHHGITIKHLIIFTTTESII